jgi:hypothetical protein
LTATKPLLKAATSHTEGADKAFDAALDRLLKRSQIVFRRHLSSFALWEGSDFDVEATLRKARANVETGESLASFLTRELPPRPFVARRHYFQKGTLRYFVARYVDGDDLAASLEKPLGDADGVVLFILPRGIEERLSLLRRLGKMVAAKRPVVAVVPRDASDLSAACQEVSALRWILNNASELAHDRTARREVLSRIGHAEFTLQRTLDQVFSPNAKSRTIWLYQGTEVPVTSNRAFNELLSRVCDQVYLSTPAWRNELINRRSLSSSAAAAFSSGQQLATI